MQSDCGTIPIRALGLQMKFSAKTCPWGKFSLSVFTAAYCVLTVWTCSRNLQICFLASVTKSSFFIFFSTTRVFLFHWECDSFSLTSFKYKNAFVFVSLNSLTNSLIGTFASVAFIAFRANAIFWCFGINTSLYLLRYLVRARYLYRSHFTKCRKWNTACLISLLHISCGGRSSYHSELFLQVIFPTFNLMIFSLELSYCWRSSLRTLTFACPYKEQYAFLFQLLSSLFIRYSLLFSDYVSEFQFSLY